MQEVDLYSKEKAIIVGVNIKNEKNFEASMSELNELVDACDIEVCGKIIQNLDKVNNAVYVGTGKVLEIKEEVKLKKADLVIFNNELSPSQLKNLSDDLNGVPILDRTALILEIFDKRARTKEAKLQVEVAKLKYMMPRLIGLHESLGRQGGGSGLNNKGSGEKKLELDRRRIEDRINLLNKELENIEIQRNTQRKKRIMSGYPLVALAGYTNAGKSTLFNTLVDIYKSDDEKKVLEKDMLFATLDTSVRSITDKENKTFLISDTVGFISKLPHNLIKAFRSTLEEVKMADLILQVIDFSNLDYLEHIEVTKETLKEIGAENIPMIYVYNKSDKVLKNIPKINENSIYISAKEKIGIEELISMVKKEVFKGYVTVDVCIPYERGDLVSFLNSNATVITSDYTDIGTKLKVEIKEEFINKINEYIC